MPPVVTSRRMLNTACPLRSDNTDSTLQSSRALYGIIWPCSWTKPRSMAKTKRGKENQESKAILNCHFYVLPRIKLEFCSLSATELGSESDLGSVCGCLPCALEASASFLGIALGFASFIDSPSHTLNLPELVWPLYLLYNEALYF